MEPWGDDPPFHMPVFVVTHRALDPLVKLGGTTYHFATGGIESALAQAQATAGGKDVGIFGGVDIIRQYVRAGLVDELRIHLVPVLLGDITALFDRTSTAPIELESTQTIAAPGVTHLIFGLTKSGAGSYEAAPLAPRRA